MTDQKRSDPWIDPAQRGEPGLSVSRRDRAQWEGLISLDGEGRVLWLPRSLARESGLTGRLPC